MMYVLIVVAVVGVVVYACLKKKRSNTEKPHEEEKPDGGGNHTGIIVKVPTEVKGYLVKDRVKKEVTIKYMPQGLQVFDENGKLLISVTDRLTRIVGEVHISDTKGEVTIHTPHASNRIYFFVSDIDVLAPGNESIELLMVPEFTLTGNKISWDIPVVEEIKKYKPINATLSATLRYGVY